MMAPVSIGTYIPGRARVDRPSRNWPGACRHPDRPLAPATAWCVAGNTGTCRHARRQSHAHRIPRAWPPPPPSPRTSRPPSPAPKAGSWWPASNSLREVWRALGQPMRFRVGHLEAPPSTRSNVRLLAGTEARSVPPSLGGFAQGSSDPSASALCRRAAGQLVRPASRPVGVRTTVSSD